MQKTRPVHRVSFLFAATLRKKIAVSFYFRNSASWKVKAFGLLFPTPTPPIAVSFAIPCIGLRWAEGVFATFLVSLPLLCCHGNRTVASALCPIPAAARPDAELTWCHRWEGPVTSVWIIYMEIRGIALGIFLPATLGVLLRHCSSTHTTPLYTNTQSWLCR